jgi:hypothetical protein
MKTRELDVSMTAVRPGRKFFFFFWWGGGRVKMMVDVWRADASGPGGNIGPR